jgi:hypothetical protein
MGLQSGGSIAIVVLRAEILPSNVNVERMSTIIQAIRVSASSQKLTLLFFLPFLELKYHGSIRRPRQGLRSRDLHSTCDLYIYVRLKSCPRH